MNLGTSPGAISRGVAAEPQEQPEQDAAIAAAELHEKLLTGHHATQHSKRRKRVSQVITFNDHSGEQPRKQEIVRSQIVRSATSPPPCKPNQQITSTQL